MLEISTVSWILIISFKINTYNAEIKDEKLLDKLDDSTYNAEIKDEWMLELLDKLDDWLCWLDTWQQGSCLII